MREADLRGRRLLDAGCGTGRLATALASQTRVWGIDASAEMLAVARERVPRNVRLKLARAEEPPFKDGWFERVVYWLVIHLLDRPAAFRAAHRVLSRGGLACAVTFDSTYFSGFWLNRYFPRFEEIDRARFPTAAELEEELLTAGKVRSASARPSSYSASSSRSNVEMWRPAIFASAVSRSMRSCW